MIAVWIVLPSHACILFIDLPMTRSINQSINQSIDRSRSTICRCAGLHDGPEDGSAHREHATDGGGARAHPRLPRQRRRRHLPAQRPALPPTERAPPEASPDAWSSDARRRRRRKGHHGRRRRRRRRRRWRGPLAALAVLAVRHRRLRQPRQAAAHAALQETKARANRTFAAITANVSDVDRSR